MSKAWMISSVLTIYCTLAAGAVPGPDALWLYATDLSPTTVQELTRHEIKTIGALKKKLAGNRYGYQTSFAISGQVAREIDTFLNGHAMSITDETYELPIEQMRMTARTLRALKAAHVDFVGQLILIRRRMSKDSFKKWMGHVQNIGHHSVVIEAIEALVESAPSAFATYLGDLDFPVQNKAKALVALEERHGITTIEQLVHVKDSMTEKEFDKWVGRLSHVGALAKPQIIAFVENSRKDCKSILTSDVYQADR